MHVLCQLQLFVDLGQHNQHQNSLSGDLRWLRLWQPISPLPLQTKTSGIELMLTKGTTNTHCNKQSRPIPAATLCCLGFLAEVTACITDNILDVPVGRWTARGMQEEDVQVED
jgi:hypothetical protein